MGKKSAEYLTITNKEFEEVMKQHEERFICVGLNGKLRYPIQIEELGFFTKKMKVNTRKLDYYVFSDLTKETGDLEIEIESIVEINRYGYSEIDNEDININLNDGTHLHIYNF